MKRYPMKIRHWIAWWVATLVAAALFYFFIWDSAH